MHFTLEAPNQHRILHRLGVEIVTYHMPTKFEEGRVLASHVYDEHGHEHEFEADAVVMVTQRRSNEALYRELKDTVGLDALTSEASTASTGSGTRGARDRARFLGPPTREIERTNPRRRSFSASGGVESEALAV